MNYTNFKKVVKDLQEIQNRHKQINSFGVGTIEQMIYLTQEVDKKDNTENYNAPIYPLMYVIPQPSTVAENFNEYSLNVVISDIMNAKNYDTQVDLWSETYQMAQDVIAQYKYSVLQSQGNYQSRYDITLPITCTPFSEGYDDLLVGWSFVLTIQVDQPLNRCIAPFDDWIQPTPEPSTSSTPTATPTPTLTPTPTSTPLEFYWNVENCCDPSITGVVRRFTFDNVLPGGGFADGNGETWVITGPGSPAPSYISIVVYTNNVCSLVPCCSRYRATPIEIPSTVSYTACNGGAVSFTLNGPGYQDFCADSPPTYDPSQINMEFLGVCI